MAFVVPFLTYIGTALGASSATAASVGALAATTAVTVGTTLYSASQASAAAKDQAAMADANARNSRMQAAAREDMVRRRNAIALGEQRAGAAQSGFESGIGSFAALQGQSAGNAELDALTTRYEGELTSLSFDNEANSLRRQAKNTMRQGYVNAAGTLMSSGARYGSSMTMPSYSFNGGMGTSNAAGISGGR